MVVSFMRAVSPLLLFVLHTEIIVKKNCINSHGHFRSTNFGDYSACIFVYEKQVGRSTITSRRHDKLRTTGNFVTDVSQCYDTINAGTSFLGGENVRASKSIFHFHLCCNWWSYASIRNREVARRGFSRISNCNLSVLN